MRNKDNQRGASLVELLVVMMLLTMLAMAVITMLIAGGNAYARLNDERTALSQARVAAGYLRVRLRQSDVRGGIELVHNAYGGQDALLFLPDPGTNNGMVTWVFFADGWLRESLVEDGMPPSVDRSFQIARIGMLWLDCDTDLGVIHGDIRYYSRGVENSLSVYVRPQSVSDPSSLVSEAKYVDAFVEDTSNPSGTDPSVTAAPTATPAPGSGERGVP